jgi:hypothetical protein
MKKIVFVLFAALSLLSGCDKDGKKQSDTFLAHLQVYDAVSLYNDLALDPFNVAYRYHIYLSGGKTQSLKNELLSQAQIIPSEDGLRDTIRFTEQQEAPQNDRVRGGDVVIHTFGSSLSDEGAVWRVTSNPNNEYYLYDPSSTYWHVGLDDSNEYLITNKGADTFGVSAKEVYIASIVSYSQTIWNWDLDVLISRTQGSGTDLSNSHFEIAAAGEDTPAASGFFNTSGDPVRYRYEIVNPVLYSSDCTYLKKSGGKEQIIRMDLQNYKGLDSLIFDFGQDINTCAPAFSVTAKTQDYTTWETHKYDPDRNWIE